MDVRSLLGSSFEHWSIEEELGRGADGIVYLVKNDTTHRALKFFFRDTLERHGAEEQIERLELQLSLKGKKHHDNLVEIFGGGYSSELETIYIFMEYIPGKTLDKLIGKVPSQAVFPLISQLAGAARFLDSQNLVHRDIKPSNIIVSDDFTKLCLLDLGIVHKSPDATQDDRRLSGDEFVASLRYSPPEFVWREEISAENDAWRAITFYQLGATLYDMIEGKNIFTGHDTPRAHLYDCVRYRSPQFESNLVDPWLIDLAKTCLVKSWRERISLVSWDRFDGPPSGEDSNDRRISIRLKQILAEEKRKLREQNKPDQLKITNLWELQEQVFSELRTLLINESIFPKFSSTQKTLSDTHYLIDFVFEADESLSFNEQLSFSVDIQCLDDSQQTLALNITAYTETKEISKGAWIEAISTERAFKICEIALFESADNVVSSSYGEDDDE